MIAGFLEQSASQTWTRFLLLVMALVTADVIVRRRARALLNEFEQSLQFEDEPLKDIYALELHRDGVVDQM